MSVFFHPLVVFPIPPLWIPAFAGMTRLVAGVYPGSESGTCFRTHDAMGAGREQKWFADH